MSDNNRPGKDQSGKGKYGKGQSGKGQSGKGQYGKGKYGKGQHGKGQSGTNRRDHRYGKDQQGGRDNREGGGYSSDKRHRDYGSEREDRAYEGDPRLWSEPREQLPSGPAGAEDSEQTGYYQSRRTYSESGEDRASYSRNEQGVYERNKPRERGPRYANERHSVYETVGVTRTHNHAAMKRQDNDETVELREDRLEGRNPIREAIAAGRTIDKLWVLQPAEGKPLDKQLNKIVYDVRAAGGVVMNVDRRTLDQMSETHGHQGVIAQTAMHEYVEVDDILERAEALGEDAFVLVLDEIQDGYNLGSMLRLADSAGVHGIIIPRRRAVGLDARVAKASAGAIEYVPVARVTNIAQTLDKLKEAGLWIAGTAGEEGTNYVETRLTGPLALVIGSEGSGLRPLVREHCDFLVSIPMAGKVNSLNAAMAGGIVVYEVLRQRGSLAGADMKPKQAGPDPQAGSDD